MAKSVMQLKCDCNQFPWGRTGEQSLAAQLCAKTNPDFKIKDDTDYSEMWMGTYPELPSYVLETGEDLQQVLNAHKDQLMGEAVVKKFGENLPFLPKILSIKKALPLQIHPDKDLAAKLHKQDPEKYSDDNHKPEIAIALGKFEAFCGFKPLSDIKALLSLEPLKQFMPEAEFNDQALRDVCHKMLTVDGSVVKDIYDKLSQLDKSKFGNDDQIPDLLPRLAEMYSPDDNGLLVALICMNFYTFQAGDSIYIPADGIHAYLTGNIVECMARSNNMINTGFCPRADRDPADLFVNALTFKQHDRDAPILKREDCEFSENGKTTAFKPPLSEFEMMVTEMKAGDKESIKPVNGPSILFCTSGKAKMKADGKEYTVNEGYIYFIGKGVKVEYEASEESAIYRPYAQ